MIELVSALDNWKLQAQDLYSLNPQEFPILETIRHIAEPHRDHPTTTIMFVLKSRQSCSFTSHSVFELALKLLDLF